jgi:resolvase-like protein/recombinase
MTSNDAASRARRRARRNANVQAEQQPEKTSGIVRVLIMERISSDPNHTAEAVDRHVRECLAYLGGQAGWQLIQVPGSPRDGGGKYQPGVLVDNDVSASETSGKLKHRPEYERGMALVAAGQVDVILSTYLSRVWRSLKEMIGTRDVLAENKIKIELIKDTSLDFRGPSGVALAGVLTVLAELEAQLTQERARSWMADAAAAGRYHGAPCFGYEPAILKDGARVPGPAGPKAGRSRTLLPLWGDREPGTLDRRPGPDHVAAAAHWTATGSWPVDDYTVGEADLVWEMAQRIDAGEPVYAILKDLDARGIPTKTGKTWLEVGNGSVIAILTAPRIIGRRKIERHGKTTMLLEEEYDADWEPILDEDLFDRVGDALDPGHRRTGTTNARKYLLPGFAVCGECGTVLKSGHLTGVNAKRMGRRARLNCPPTPHGCGRVGRDMADVENQVIRVMTQWMTAGGRYDQAVGAQRTAAAQARAAIADAELAGLLARKAQYEADLEAMDENLADRTWTKEKYLKQVDRKRRQIAEMDAQMPGPAPEPSRVLDGWPRGEAFAQRWAELETRGTDSLQERRSVLAELVGKVVILKPPRGTPAGRGRGEHHRADPKYTVVYPGGWWPDWEPEPLGAQTLDDQVLAWLATQDGARTRAQVAEGAGVNADSAHRSLKRLTAAGSITETWEQKRTPAGRAAYTYCVA